MIFILATGNNNARMRPRQSDPCRQFCDPAATCRIERPGYDEVAHCQCPAGYLDVSPDRYRQPGQKCRQRRAFNGDDTFE